MLLIDLIRNSMNLNRAAFEELKTYCLFIGYPRSGHTLYGALLDAHPNCVISHELNVLQLMKQGRSNNQVYKAILKNAQSHAREGRKNEGYHYEVKNQWQGKYKDLHVIGDKQGGRTSRMLSEDPELLNQLSALLKIQIKILHVYRNPLDNIASRSKGGKLQKKESSVEGIKKDILKHFNQVNINDKIRKAGKFEVLDIQHEKFIEEPVKGLKRICEFLELQTTEDYLKDCASIVFQKPHQTRFDIDFPEELIRVVDEQIKKYDFLSRYSFDDS